MSTLEKNVRVELSAVDDVDAQIKNSIVTLNDIIEPLEQSLKKYDSNSTIESMQHSLMREDDENFLSASNAEEKQIRVEAKQKLKEKKSNQLKLAKAQELLGIINKDGDDAAVGEDNLKTTVEQLRTFIKTNKDDDNLIKLAEQVIFLIIEKVRKDRITQQINVIKDQLGNTFMEGRKALFEFMAYNATYIEQHLWCKTWVKELEEQVFNGFADTLSASIYAGFEQLVSSKGNEIPIQVSQFAENITNYVIDEILACPNLVLRNLRIEHYILLAMKLCNSGNNVAAASITASLQKSHIIKLYQEDEVNLLSKSTKSILNKLVSLYSGTPQADENLDQHVQRWVIEHPNMPKVPSLMEWSTLESRGGAELSRLEEKLKQLQESSDINELHQLKIASLERKISIIGPIKEKNFSTAISKWLEGVYTTPSPNNAFKEVSSVTKAINEMPGVIKLKVKIEKLKREKDSLRQGGKDVTDTTALIKKLNNERLQLENPLSDKWDTVVKSYKPKGVTIGMLQNIASQLDVTREKLEKYSDSYYGSIRQSKKDKYQQSLKLLQIINSNQSYSKMLQDLNKFITETQKLQHRHEILGRIGQIFGRQLKLVTWAEKLRSQLKLLVPKEEIVEEKKTETTIPVKKVHIAEEVESKILETNADKQDLSGDESDKEDEEFFDSINAILTEPIASSHPHKADNLLKTSDDDLEQLIKELAPDEELYTEFNKEFEAILKDDEPPHPPLKNHEPEKSSAANIYQTHSDSTKQLHQDKKTSLPQSTMNRVSGIIRQFESHLLHQDERGTKHKSFHDIPKDGVKQKIDKFEQIKRKIHGKGSINFDEDNEGEGEGGGFKNKT